MAKASDLIGKSGAGGLGPPTGASAFKAPAGEPGKKAPKSKASPKNESKSVKADAKARGGASTTTPSVRPKV